MAELLSYKSANGYWRVEAGLTRLRADQLKIIADLFEVPVEELLISPEKEIEQYE
jgi:transcriptional regulator with XRE-family HTH domain